MGAGREARSSRRRGAARLSRVVCAAAALGAMAAGSLGALPATAATPTHVQVLMQHFKFCVSGDCSRATATVRVGDSVTWVFNDGNILSPPSCADFLGQCPGHTATTAAGAPARFDSGTLSTNGQAYTVTFGRAGTYSYYCIYHGGPSPNQPVTHMNGVVVVEAAQASQGTTTTSTAGLPNTFMPGLPDSGAGPARTAPPLLALALAAVLAGLGAVTRPRARG